MAGNIVKWWRHKILGGYKQFTVLQECTTDSEELIYPMRAPSSCSAPPDLLLPAGEREPMVKSPRKVLKEFGREAKHRKKEHDRVHLEEFTCDVSVEGTKQPQPIQFSFTLYDLDGHGKITKDDIAGIVSTIYESIGKSVVVPHYGSKTINVKLTVSPDAKTKPTTTTTTASPKKSFITPRRRYRPRKLISDDDCSDTSENDHQLPTTANAQSQPHTNNNNISASITKKSTKHSRLESHILRSSNKNNKSSSNEQADTTNNRISKDCSTTTTTTDSANETSQGGKVHVSFEGTTSTPPPPQLINPSECSNNAATTIKPSKSLRANKDENIYESVNNLKCCTQAPPNCCLLDVNHCSFHIDEQMTKSEQPSCTVICRDCSIDPNSLLANCSKPKKKLLRKSRSRRPKQTGSDEPPVSRMRSLSVGNENCYKSIQQTQEERWKSSLRRHELIQIIRESMEKNRLCFQANRKPIESPTHHRHRSHTISKMGEDQMPTSGHHGDSASQGHATNLCGYDGFLHATICSNANNNNVHFTTTSNPVQFVGTPNRFIHHHSKKSRVKAHEAARLTMSATRSNNNNTTTPLKSILTPASLQALSVEQKMNRSLNHVEKWLERDHSQPGSNKNLKTDDLKLHEASTRLRTNNENVKNKPKLQRSKSKEEIMSRDKSCLINPDIFLEKLKITENLVETNVTPKKVTNKDPVLTTKKPAGAKQSQKTTADKGSKNVVLEYSTIPVNADPTECENLLRITSDDDTLNNELSNDSTVHQYVHIHHHYHHFENDEC